MLACRGCRKPLTAAEGCAICFSVKANLVTTEEDAEEHPALSDVAAETVSALQSILKKHRLVLKDGGAAVAALDNAEEGAIRVANTVAKVLESARKLQLDGLAAVRNMSFGDRAKLFAEWYQSLPPMYRKKVQDGMVKFEGDVSLEIPQLSAGDANAK